MVTAWICFVRLLNLKTQLETMFQLCTAAILMILVISEGVQYLAYTNVTIPVLTCQVSEVYQCYYTNALLAVYT